MEEIQSLWPEEFKTTSSHRFRGEGKAFEIQVSFLRPPATQTQQRLLYEEEGRRDQVVQIWLSEGTTERNHSRQDNRQDSISTNGRRRNDESLQQEPVEIRDE